MTTAHQNLLDGQYPETWDEYVGQPAAKRTLKVTTASAKLRGDNLPHILICSPNPGSGKTALALMTVRESGRPVFLASGTMKLTDARMMFSQVEDGDIVFYDEFHKIMDGGKRHAEWLLNYLENGVLLTPFGEERVPRVSFIAATTDKGLVAPAILDRFKLVELAPYTEAEAADIAVRLATKLFAPVSLPVVHRDVAAAIALAGSRQPRRMRDIIISLRDLAVVGEVSAPRNGKYDLTEALEFADLTPDGLTKEARNYLSVMYREMRAEPAGAALLRERLGLVGKGLQYVEQLLLDKGLITKTKTGRMLTAAGMKRATQLSQSEEVAA